jgi:hypothetical protein
LGVRDQLPELRLFLVTNGLRQRNRRLRRAPDRLDLVRLDPGHVGNFLDCRLAPEADHELALRSTDPVELLDDMDGDPDRPCLVRKRTGHRLADPPSGVVESLKPFGNRTSRWRGRDRACPPGSGRGTAIPGCGNAWRSRPPAAGLPRPSAAWPPRSHARSAWQARPPREPSDQKTHLADALQKQLQTVRRPLWLQLRPILAAGPLCG